MEQQRAIQNQNYRYQPHDTVVRQHYQEQAAQRERAPAPSTPVARDAADRNARPPVMQPQQSQRGSDEPARSIPPQQAAPPQQHAPAAQEQRRPEPQAQQAPREREQQMQRPAQDNMPQSKGAAPESRRGQNNERERADERSDERGSGRNR